MARPPLSRLLALLVGLGLLAACAGPGTSPPSTPAAQEPAAQPQEPPVAPTRGGGGDETPLPEPKAQPVLTTAVAGTGNGTLVAPDTICVFWTWGGDGLPQLTDGLSFAVDHAQVVPETWMASRDACGDSGDGVQWCDGAQMTVDSSTCAIGFVRSGTPSAQALVGMVGTLQCTLSADDCAAFTQAVDDSPDVSSDLDLEAVAGGDG